MSLEGRSPGDVRLSPREFQLAWLVSEGMMPRKIAASFGIKATSVSSKMSGIYRKLGVDGREGLTQWFRHQFPTSKERWSGYNEACRRMAESWIYSKKTAAETMEAVSFLRRPVFTCSAPIYDQRALTPREIEVCAALFQCGGDGLEIQKKLRISRDTLMQHLKSAREKSGTGKTIALSHWFHAKYPTAEKIKEAYAEAYKRVNMGRKTPSKVERLLASLGK